MKQILRSLAILAAFVVLAAGLTSERGQARAPRGGAATSAPARLAIGASSQAASNFTAALATTAVTTQTTGSTFVIFEATDAGLLAPTDNKGNTYNLSPDLTFLYNSSADAGVVWICSNCAGGAGHVFTANFSSSSSAVLIVVEITSTGGHFAGIDQSAISSNLANVTTANAPSVTPTVNGEVILSFLGGLASVNITINDSTGYSNILQSNGNAASNGNFVGAVGGLAQTTAAATHDVFTLSATSNAGTATISFKPH